jgi:hypothetical protein
VPRFVDPGTPEVQEARQGREAQGSQSCQGGGDSERHCSAEYDAMERRVRKKNAELNSLRCDTKIKLGIASEFLDREFYFPYNLDFRGRCAWC